MLHYYTRFGNKMFCDSENIIQQTFTDILNFAVTLTLNAVIPFFHWTLRLVMLCYQTKFGCKPTRSLQDTTEIIIFDYINPCCDLDIEQSEPFFLHDTLAYDAARPCQVW